MEGKHSIGTTAITCFKLLFKLVLIRVIMKGYHQSHVMCVDLQQL